MAQQSKSTSTRRIAVLGSTGSIGVQTLEVIEHLGERCQVVGLATSGNLDRLMEQVRKFEPEVVVEWDEAAAATIRDRKLTVRGRPLVVLSGLKGLIELAAWPNADYVVSAVVGTVGLEPLLAALRAGKTVALANKESLTMAGELVMGEAKKHGATLLPVDSEHSAVFQCLQGQERRAVKRLLLTASGGPFYRSQEDLSKVTAAQALAHPTWKMGPKVTIDSATLMNKGLETLEASILFGIPLDQVGVVIHPQSIVHSMVDFVDGTMLAQLSWPDMRLPIQYSLTYPDRLPGCLATLDLPKVKTLDFFEPDFARFPCLTLAREAGMKRGTWPAVLNAADEVAVQAFLRDEIKFTDIAKVVEKTLSKHQGNSRVTLETIVETDRWARATAKEFLK
jgi:1-deoxy-D-xylulose-5-phosphate reductoisomerase